jgi:uncharacterized protein
MRPRFSALSPNVLKKIERSEDFLQGLGIRQARVRYHGSIARIEVMVKDFEKVIANQERISEALQAYGFSFVTLDLKGHRTGSMNVLADVPSFCRHLHY